MSYDPTKPIFQPAAGDEPAQLFGLPMFVGNPSLGPGIRTPAQEADGKAAWHEHWIGIDLATAAEELALLQYQEHVGGEFFRAYALPLEMLEDRRFNFAAHFDPPLPPASLFAPMWLITRGRRIPRKVKKRLRRQGWTIRGRGYPYRFTTGA